MPGLPGIEKNGDLPDSGFRRGLAGLPLITLSALRAGCASPGLQADRLPTRVEGAIGPVQILEPDRPNGSKPTVVLVPGGGLSSAIYLAGGRRSWARQIARAGYRVVLVDPPDASAPPRWTAATAFPVWGIDQGGRSRFHARRSTDIGKLLASPRQPLSADQLGTLLSAYAPTVVIGHSFGGRTAMQAAGKRADVRGLALVEPLACPTQAARLREAFVETRRPLLSIWGDNLDRGAPAMTSRRQACVTASNEIVAQGGAACVLDLPALGISGNSHLMMAENNAGTIGAFIVRWLAQFGSTATVADPCGRPRPPSPS